MNKKRVKRTRSNDIRLSAKEYERSGAVKHWSPNGHTTFWGNNIYNNEHESKCSTKHTVCLGYEKIGENLGEIAGFINLDVGYKEFSLEISTAHTTILELEALDMSILRSLRDFLNYSVKEYSHDIYRKRRIK